MLDPITGALLVLGVGLSLRRIRQPGSFLLIAWLLIMLVPAIFSLDFESPQSYRAIGSLPAACLLAVVPIHALWQEWLQDSENILLPCLFSHLLLCLAQWDTTTTMFILIFKLRILLRGSLFTAGNNYWKSDG